MLRLSCRELMSSLSILKRCGKGNSTAGLHIEHSPAASVCVEDSVQSSTHRVTQHCRNSYRLHHDNLLRGVSSSSTGVPDAHRSRDSCEAALIASHRTGSHGSISIIARQGPHTEEQPRCISHQPSQHLIARLTGNRPLDSLTCFPYLHLHAANIDSHALVADGAHSARPGGRREGGGRGRGRQRQLSHPPTMGTVRRLCPDPQVQALALALAQAEGASPHPGLTF